MPHRGSRTALALGAIIVAVAMTGCGSSKLSANETAIWLEKHRVANGVHMTCQPGKGRWSDWDYSCTASGDQLSGASSENTYGYNVDSKGVTAFSG